MLQSYRRAMASGAASSRSDAEPAARASWELVRVSSSASASYPRHPAQSSFGGAMAGPEDKHGPTAPPPPSPLEAEDDIGGWETLRLHCAEDAVALQREAGALLDSSGLGHATPILEDRWRRYVVTHADWERMTKGGVVACDVKQIPGLRSYEFVVTTRNGHTWHWRPGGPATQRRPYAWQPPVTAMTAADRTCYGKEKMLHV